MTITSKTAAAKRRDINREELKRYLSERGKVSYVFDSIEKLEDVDTPLEPVQVQRISKAIDARLRLLNKYLPDEKAVEIKNSEGEIFKTDSKWTVEFVNATPKD